MFSPSQQMRRSIIVKNETTRHGGGSGRSRKEQKRPRGGADFVVIMLYSITAFMVLSNMILMQINDKSGNADSDSTRIINGLNLGTESASTSINTSTSTSTTNSNTTTSSSSTNTNKDLDDNVNVDILIGSQIDMIDSETVKSSEKTIIEETKHEEEEAPQSKLETMGGKLGDGDGDGDGGDKKANGLDDGDEDKDKPHVVTGDHDHDNTKNLFPSEYFGSTNPNPSIYTPKGANRFQEWKDGTTPYQITPSIQHASDDMARARRTHIQNAMKHAWGGYKTHAFGADEVLPLSGTSRDVWGGIGVTLVDALDTLWIMDLKDEFYEARDWMKIPNNLNFDIDKDVSVFETTIRSLGGLLSAYGWSGEDVFLEKAIDLGDRLIKAFDEPRTNGIPIGQVNLKTGRTSSPEWLHGKIILADMATLPVEFRQLSKFTQDPKYAEKAEKVFHLLKGIEPRNGLFPYFLNVENGKLSFENSSISFGPFGDSFYEYELKIWLQGGRKEDMYREMYDKSMNGMHNMKLKKSKGGLTYINFGSDHNRMDHLTCFMGGLLALGAWTDPTSFESARAQIDLKTSKALVYTCYQMYASMPTGLSADEISFKGSQIVPKDASYKLRPETVESLFILHKITGDPIYREWGWEIFQSIEKYCRTDIAYGKLKDVMVKRNPEVEDQMESFFLGETLKYLYLLFDPDTEVEIDKYVFNTEAHPFLIK